MSDSIQKTTAVEDPSSHRQHGGIGQIGVFSEQARLLAGELGTELLEVARKQVSLSRGESEELPPEERGESFEDGESSCGIKRPESHLSTGTGDFAPESISAGLDVLLVGARAEDGVRSCQSLTGSGRNGVLGSEPAFEQASKEFLGRLASERGQGVPTLEPGKIAEALLEALGSERLGQADDTIEEHGNVPTAVDGIAQGLRVEALDTLLAEMELAGPGSEPRARKRPNPVGLAGVGGTRLVDADKNFKAAHDSTPNQLGGACR